MTSKNTSTLDGSFASAKSTERFEIENPKNMIEEILDRIGIGRYHYFTYAVVGIAYLTDGAEVLTIALLNYVVVHSVWHRSLDDVGLMGSLIFAGFFIGSLLSGPISDKYGRKYPFLSYLLLMFGTGVASALAPNWEVLLWTRALFGIVIGLLSPTATSVVTEVTPRQRRGIAFIIVSSLFTFGELFSTFLGQIMHVETSESAWRALLIWSSVPALVAFVLGWIFLKESPRHKILQNADEGIQVFKHMYRTNHGYEFQIGEYEREKLNEWVENQKKLPKASPISELVKGKLLRTSILVWISWWVLSFVYYGITYSLPLIIGKLNNTSNNANNDEISYQDLYVAAIAEIPSYVLAVFAIEWKNLGRKYSVILSFACCALGCFGTHFFSRSLFIWFILFAKFWANSAFAFMAPYTSELYPTQCRATGLGFASAASRIGGMIMPWVIVRTLEIQATLPLFVFGVASAVGAVACALLPYDTTGRTLDLAEGEK